MNTYIRLLRLTDKGLERIRDQAVVFAEVKSAIESFGGELTQTWVCQGNYDIVSFIQAPDEQTMNNIDQAMKKSGLYRGPTMLAMPMTEFVETFGSSSTAAQFVHSWFTASRSSRGR
jgi:uncharacterized protein with GYD domain